VREEINPASASVMTVGLLAQALAAVGDGAGAEQVLGQAAAARPDQVVLLDALGKLLERQGPSRRGKAIEYYRAARARRPGLGIALGAALIRAGRADEAEEVLRELARQQPDNAALYNTLGISLFTQKKFAAAVAAYRKATALPPALAEAHYNLGLALAARGRHRAAEAAYRKAIELRPDFAEAYNNLGLELSQQQKHGAAEAAYRKATELKPDFAKAHANLGKALSERGKHRAAEAAYRKAIELQPDLAGAYNGLGNVLASGRKYRDAEAAYRKAIELEPDLAEVYYNLGLILGAQRKYGEAEAAYRKAVDLQPAFAEANFNLAHALMEQALFDEALAFMKKGYALLPAQDPRREVTRPLLRRCQRYMTLDARLPRILRGADKPANAAEQIEFARLCVFKKLYAAAAHLYGDAFRAEPKLAEPVPPGNRYYAACAAAQAGCARGRDADTLDDKGRARWRRQAREWLRQDLTWWGKALDNGNAQTRTDVRWRMRYWQTDRELAGLREPGALEALYPDERKECLALWQEVAAVLRRVQTSR
jgi:tetratricopeptide (TPR) repeat protein